MAQQPMSSHHGIVCPTLAYIWTVVLPILYLFVAGIFFCSPISTEFSLTFGARFSCLFVFVLCYSFLCHFVREQSPSSEGPHYFIFTNKPRYWSHEIPPHMKVVLKAIWCYPCKDIRNVLEILHDLLWLDQEQNLARFWALLELASSLRNQIYATFDP